MLISETGAWQPFTMRIDAAPFDDVQVRQAFRLIVDRKQMVQQVLSGQGRIGNDLFARYDPSYANDLPQREQDLEQAKSLLKQAGKRGPDASSSSPRPCSRASSRPRRCSPSRPRAPA